MSDLWLEASRDIEADDAVVNLNKAKLVTASMWPFFALAMSENEFDHRLALAMDQLEDKVPDEKTRNEVIASFREDFGFYRQAADEAEGDEEPDGDADDEKPWEKDASLQIFHEASGQWITVEAAAEATPGNPGFPNPAPEEGPITGQTGTYPQHPTGADPVDPINQMFPMQPGEWKEIPELWVDRPMNFAPYQNPGNYGKTSAQVHPDHPGHYTNEGVETGLGPNPFYFAGGEEGVAGNQQTGFPADVTAPEDREDSRVDFYGAVPPVYSTGTTGDGHSYSNQGNLNNSKESAKDNHGACYDCNQPVYRQGNEWHHLGIPPQNGHSVRLPSDHPWVQARMSTLKSANKYIHKDGDDWVIVQKGTGKVLSRHDSEEKANESFAAMEMNKHSVSEERKGKKNAFLRTAEFSAEDTDSGGSANVPQPPPSMMPGGAGAEAMPPMNQAMTIPNDQVRQHPFPNEPAGGGGGANPFTSGNPFMGVKHTANPMTRDRPDMFNPTGVGDEYTERTWEGGVRQSPRQPMEERGVNTPQRPMEPIRQNTSDGGPRDEEEDED